MKRKSSKKKSNKLTKVFIVSIIIAVVYHSGILGLIFPESNTVTLPNGEVQEIAQVDQSHINEMLEKLQNQRSGIASDIFESSQNSKSSSSANDSEINSIFSKQEIESRLEQFITNVGQKSFIGELAIFSFNDKIWSVNLKINNKFYKPSEVGRNIRKGTQISRALMEIRAPRDFSLSPFKTNKQSSDKDLEETNSPDKFKNSFKGKARVFVEKDGKRARLTTDVEVTIIELTENDILKGYMTLQTGDISQNDKDLFLEHTGGSSYNFFAKLNFEAKKINIEKEIAKSKKTKKTKKKTK